MACAETGSLPQEMTMPRRTFSRSNSSRRPSRFTTSWAAVNGRSTVVKRRPQRAHSRRPLDAVAGVAGVRDAGVIVVAVGAPHPYCAFLALLPFIVESGKCPTRYCVCQRFLRLLRPYAASLCGFDVPYSALAKLLSLCGASGCTIETKVKLETAWYSSRVFRPARRSSTARTQGASMGLLTTPRSSLVAYFMAGALALVAMSVSCGGGETSTAGGSAVVASTAPTAATAAATPEPRGKVNYVTHCSACHGVSGEGQPNWLIPGRTGRCWRRLTTTRATRGTTAMATCSR